MKIARFDEGPEIFFSIQGEGKSLGRPSIFVRTSLCNLHCRWCDTDYTWNWQGTSFRHARDDDPNYRKYDKAEQIVEMTPQEVAAAVRALPCTNVVLTGGEPLLQQDDLVTVMQLLRESDGEFWFEVETNGTLKPTAEFDQLINQYNVSPKTSNSQNAAHLCENAEALTFFAANSKTAFKFVIADPADLSEVRQLLESYEAGSSQVYLMPEGTSSQQLRSRQQWLIEECKRGGYNFTDRLHIHIWGDKRGV